VRLRRPVDRRSVFRRGRGGGCSRRRQHRQQYDFGHEQHEQCEALQLPKDAVACIAGRCVAGFECDSSKVTCKLLPPVCEPGFVPGVKETCYTGTCVPVTECVSVKSCSDCGKFACANHATRTGPQAHCVTIPAACGDTATCACFGPTVCTKPYSSCSDFSGVRGVSCTCPTCL
jgi:hypothetical protein